MSAVIINERIVMTVIPENDPKKTDAGDATPDQVKTSNPRDTDHPTGTKQAEENAANESPS
jgi:hypothetical protein